MALVTGFVVIKVDGVSIRSKADATLKFGGFDREGIYADGVLVGPQEKPVSAEITANMVHTSDTDIDRIRNLRSGSGTFTTNTGTTYGVRAMFAKTTGELNADDGTVKVEFEGQAAIKTS